MRRSARSNASHRPDRSDRSARSGRWLLGARPRTLPASVAPVLVGTAVADAHHSFIAWRAAAALVVAVALQVGANYANDFQDGARGTDRRRVGPPRLVASGRASVAEVRVAAVVSLAVAAAAGVALAVAAGPWVLAVGAGCMAAAWLYTGGPRPYGYAGYGELFVFVCFGLVAVAGTDYVQEQHLTGLGVAAAIPVGLLAVALLVVNNLRDIDGDAVAGKRTLAVRIGARHTRTLYAVCVTLPFAAAVVLAPWHPGALLVLAAAALARDPLRRVRRGEVGRDLVPVLAGTARLQLSFAALLAAGLVVA